MGVERVTKYFSVVAVLGILIGIFSANIAQDSGNEWVLFWAVILVSIGGMLIPVLAKGLVDIDEHA